MRLRPSHDKPTTPRRRLQCCVGGLLGLQLAALAGTTVLLDDSIPARHTVADVAQPAPTGESGDLLMSNPGRRLPPRVVGTALPSLAAQAAPLQVSPVHNGIPAAALSAYRHAATVVAGENPGCGLRWSVLAAIGRVESDHGRYGGASVYADGSVRPVIRGIPLDGRAGVARIADTDGGSLDGDSTFDRAMGPMQFIPSTWRHYAADGNGDDKADPDNVRDAALAAAHYLCAGGADTRDPAALRAAVLRYNNSQAYADLVLAIAAAYARGDVPVLPDATGPVPPRRESVTIRPTTPQPPRPPRSGAPSSTRPPAPTTTTITTPPSTSPSATTTTTTPPPPTTTTQPTTTPTTTTPTTTTPPTTPTTTTSTTTTAPVTDGERR